MELILWRHADAQDGPVDLKRELTDKGRRQAGKVARWLLPRLEGDWRVLVSPAERAKQTADALEIEYEIRASLGPSASPEALIREAGWPAGEANVIIVGHQPTLGRLAARLLTGQERELAVKKGAIWWFSGKRATPPGTGETLLRAVVGPDFAR